MYKGKNYTRSFNRTQELELEFRFIFMVQDLVKLFMAESDGFCIHRTINPNFIQIEPPFIGL